MEVEIDRLNNPYRPLPRGEVDLVLVAEISGLLYGLLFARAYIAFGKALRDHCTCNRASDNRLQPPWDKPQRPSALQHSLAGPRKRAARSALHLDKRGLTSGARHTARPGTSTRPSSFRAMTRRSSTYQGKRLRMETSGRCAEWMISSLSASTALGRRLEVFPGSGSLP